ncbi:hypothetical protein [uncultured Bacteroides sp.]|uniref:hypothetical protein n=1 Tax=uncultured Bacteroides sp. TaxID=162156 RepID=UPI002AA5E844|nr:hypothetical protein [uncultured Bacteroides sp.]
MKTRSFCIIFLLLLFPQLILNAFCVQNEVLKRKDLHYNSSQDVKTRSPELTLTGYFEDGSLFLFFNKNLDDSKVCITDTETGIVVYDSQISGNTLIIPYVDENSSIFKIDIISGNIKVSGKIYLN